MRKVIFILVLVSVLGMGSTIASATSPERPIQDMPVPAGIVEPLLFQDDSVRPLALPDDSVEPMALPDDSSLVFVPVAPCRIIDTRLAGGKIAAGGTRNFYAWGGDLSIQGGSATGCGVNSHASAIAVTFTATQEDGAGNLRAWPYSASMPTASVLNYRAGVDIANSTILPICIFCAYEFTVYANVSGTHLVADVTGYFIKKTPAVLTAEALTGTFSASTPLCTTAAFTPTWPTKALVDGSLTAYNGTTQFWFNNILMYSTDGGSTWNIIGEYVPVATVFPGGWASASASKALDLTPYTTYIFSVQSSSNAPAGTNSSCIIRVNIVDK